jgi:hypothetical protein
MIGYPLKVVNDVSECQARCASIPGCAHYSFWKLGKHCHVQGPRAIAEPTVFFVSGPPRCDGEEKDDANEQEEEETSDPESKTTTFRRVLKNEVLKRGQAKLVQQKFQDSWSAPLASHPKLCLWFVVSGLSVIAVFSAARLFQTVSGSLRRAGRATPRSMEGGVRTEPRARAFSLLQSSAPPPSSSEASESEDEGEAPGRPPRQEVISI